MNTVIFHRFDAKIYEKRIPGALGEKLKFLRRAMNRIPDLSSYAADGKAIATEGLALKAHRNILAHGALLNIDSKGFHYAVLGNTNDNMSFGNVTYSHEQMTHLAKESAALSQRAFALHKRFMLARFNESNDASSLLGSV